MASKKSVEVHMSCRTGCVHGVSRADQTRQVLNSLRDVLAAMLRYALHVHSCAAVKDKAKEGVPLPGSRAESKIYTV